MQKLLGNEVKVFVVDESTGQMYPLEGINSIEEISLENEDDENQIVHFFDDMTFSCELDNQTRKSILKLLLPRPQKKLSKIGDDSIGNSKPNPVYVPKHIARRRKW